MNALSLRPDAPQARVSGGGQGAGGNQPAAAAPPATTGTQGGRSGKLLGAAFDPTLGGLFERDGRISLG